MDFYSFLEEIKEQRPDHVVFSVLEGEERRDITVAEWIKEIYNYAAWLESENISGKHIGLICENCYEWYVYVFGIALSGNVAVPLNPDLAADELLYQIRHADVSEVYYDPCADLDECLEEIQGEIPAVQIGLPRKWAQEADLGEQVQNLGTDPDKTVLILFSSGTSGLPKGVMLSQKGLLNVKEVLNGRFDGARLILALPQYHIGGLGSALVFLRCPATICLGEGKRYLVRDIKRFQPTVVFVVPSQLDFLMLKCRKSKEFEESIRNTVKYILSAGAPLGHEHEEVLKKWGIETCNVYGLTETSGTVMQWFPCKSGAAGRFSCENEMKIEGGELLIRGDNVMKGYYKNPEADAEVFQDGWFHTGDLVRVDEEGFLYIVGRSKNIIILSNGENVSPEILEQRIRNLKIAEEVIVTGRNNVLEALLFCGEKAGEEEKKRAQDSIRKMNKELPRFQQIQRITFVDAPFEKNGTGKLIRP